MGDYCHLCLRVFSDEFPDSSTTDQPSSVDENKSNGKTNKTNLTKRTDDQYEPTCEKIKCVNCNRYTSFEQVRCSQSREKHLLKRNIIRFLGIDFIENT